MKPNSRLDIGLLILRIGLGLIMVFFGSQKMFGVFGGHGYSTTVTEFTGGGFPPVFAHLAIAGEFFGGLGVLLGGLTAVAAFGVMCTMAVATYTVASPPGALHTMFATGDGRTICFPLALFFMALAVMIVGPGRFSLDSRFFVPKGRR